MLVSVLSCYDMFFEIENHFDIQSSMYVYLIRKNTHHLSITITPLCVFKYSRKHRKLCYTPRLDKHSAKQKNLENLNWSEKRHIYSKTTCSHGSKEVHSMLSKILNKTSLPMRLVTVFGSGWV